MSDPRRDPLETLREPVVPVDPDPAFAARLRDRVRRAMLASTGATGETRETEGMTMNTSSTEPAEATMNTLSPYICVDDARRALDWYAEALGARLRGEPYMMEDGRVGHAELMFGGSLMMLADEFPEIGVRSPRTLGGSACSLHLQVPDVDATVARAVELGAELDRPVADQPYGRGGVIIDPFGHRWMILTP